MLCRELFIDKGGLGEGHAHWYAVAVLDSKEEKFKAILTQRLKELAPLEDPVTGEEVERELEIWVPTKVMQVRLVPASNRVLSCDKFVLRTDGCRPCHLCS